MGAASSTASNLGAACLTFRDFSAQHAWQEAMVRFVNLMDLPD